MRADRLLSLLMLLQPQGKMTAKALAKKLEVSERTIYRDINALSIAGVPVFGEPGPEGGFDLLDSYRTDLTGLTKSETRALFMLNVPDPLSELGVSQDLQRAFLKLLSALPDSSRRDEEDVRQRVHLDSTWWQQGNEPLPYLRTIEKAVWEDRRLIISYRLHHAIEMEHCVDPYGLVAKAGVWYLVFARAGRVRAQQVSELRHVVLTDENFERQREFDLGAFWKGWCEEREINRTNYQVTVRVAERLIPELPIHFGQKILDLIDMAEPPDHQGRISLVLTFETPQAARERLLSFGNAIEVLEPLALRSSIADYAHQIAALYETKK